MGRWTRWRRVVQIAIALFYLALPLLNRAEMTFVLGTLASLRIGPIDLVEPAAGVAAVFAAGEWPRVLALGMLPVIALALVAGPVFCSWVCPWGLISEGIDAVRRRGGRGRGWEKRSWVGVRRTRGSVLIGIVAAGALFGVPLAAIVSAPRLITTLAAEGLFLRSVGWTTGGLLLALLLFEVLGARRLWCRALCPVGALANYLRTPRTLAIRYEASTCLHENPPACHVNCRWGLDPRQIRTFDGCTNCLACVDGCPTASLRPALGRANRSEQD